MAKDEIKQIMINGHLVGIVGLDDSIKKIAENTKAKMTKKSKIFCFTRFLSITMCLPPHMKLMDMRFYANLR